MSSRLFPGLSVSTATKDDPPWWTPHAPELPTTAYMCPECATDKWVAIEEEEATCRRCGHFFGYEVTASAEYRWFGADDRSPDPTRVGNPMNPLLPESSLGTRIMARPGESRAMQKIRQYHLWNVMPYRERTLWNVFEGLAVRAANAGISAAILEETKQLYAQVSPLCICRGQQKEALMAACLFESLKRHDTPRPPAEIADIFKIDLKLITKGVKQFTGLLDEHLHATARRAGDNAVAAATAKAAAITIATAKKLDDYTSPTELTIKVPETAANTTANPATPVIPAPIATPSTNFRHYLEPAILRLETSRAMLGVMEDTATCFGALLDEWGVCPETTPPSLAACSLALAMQFHKFPKTNQEVAGVCGISVATLQKCMKRIENWRAKLEEEVRAHL